MRPGAEPAGPAAVPPRDPEWRCVLAIPTPSRDFQGGPRRRRSDGCAGSGRAALIAQFVLTSLLLGLAERDLTEFGAATTRIQRLVGESFASVQGGVFHPRAGGLSTRCSTRGRLAPAELVATGRLGVVEGEQAGRELSRRMDAELAEGGSVELVRFDNHGARVESA